MRILGVQSWLFLSRHHIPRADYPDNITVARHLKSPRSGISIMSLKNELADGMRYNIPVAKSALFNPGARNPIAGMLPFLHSNTCPYCGKHMEVDDQPESVFVFCEKCNGGFEVSLHMDMETKEAVLAYASVAGLTGIVDPEVLHSLEAVLVRKSYSS